MHHIYILKKSTAYKINNSFYAEVHPVVFHFGNRTRDGNRRKLPKIPTSHWGLGHDRDLYHTHFHAEDGICIWVIALSHRSKKVSNQLNLHLWEMFCWLVAPYQQAEKGCYDNEKISFCLYPDKAVQEKQRSLRLHWCSKSSLHCWHIPCSTEYL